MNADTRALLRLYDAVYVVAPPTTVTGQRARRLSYTLRTVQPMPPLSNVTVRRLGQAFVEALDWTDIARADWRQTKAELQRFNQAVAAGHGA